MAYLYLILACLVSGHRELELPFGAYLSGTHILQRLGPALGLYLKVQQQRTIQHRPILAPVLEWRGANVQLFITGSAKWSLHRATFLDQETTCGEIG